MDTPVGSNPAFAAFEEFIRDNPCLPPDPAAVLKHLGYDTDTHRPASDHLADFLLPSFVLPEIRKVFAVADDLSAGGTHRRNIHLAHELAHVLSGRIAHKTRVDFATLDEYLTYRRRYEDPMNAFAASFVMPDPVFKWLASWTDLPGVARFFGVHPLDVLFQLLSLLDRPGHGYVFSRFSTIPGVILDRPHGAGFLAPLSAEISVAPDLPHSVLLVFLDAHSKACARLPMDFKYSMFHTLALAEMGLLNHVWESFAKRPTFVLDQKAFVRKHPTGYQPPSDHYVVRAYPFDLRRIHDDTSEYATHVFMIALHDPDEALYKHVVDRMTMNETPALYDPFYKDFLESANRGPNIMERVLAEWMNNLRDHFDYRHRDYTSFFKGITATLRPHMPMTVRFEDGRTIQWGRPPSRTA